MNENKPRRRAQAQAAQKATRKSGLSRFVLMVTMMALVAVVSIGGTMAWLQDNTEKVTNTFTTSGIDIKLVETEKDGTAETMENTYQLIPGKEYKKDPVVSVDNAKTNIDVILFVEFNPGVSDTYLNYTSNLSTDNGWTKVESTDNVWWRIVKDNDETQSFALLKDNKVTVDPELLKADTDNSTLSMPDASFTMEYTAYAIQAELFATKDAEGNYNGITDTAWSTAKGLNAGN